jgi:predicted nucleic acid-binding protein
MRLRDRLPSPSAASYVLSLAFDERVRIFASPHILRNVHRLMLTTGQTERTVAKCVEFIAEACVYSGGAIVDPLVRDYAIGDQEDNNIRALAKDPAVDADVVVSSDHQLINLGPAWNVRLMMRP